MFDAYPLSVDSRIADIAIAFGSTRNTQVFMNALYIFGVLALVVVISLALKRLMLLRDNEPAKIRARTLKILNQALRHRSRIDASFHPIDTARLVLACALEEVRQDRISLELPAGIETSNNWIGRELVCFFRIPGEHGRPFFYKFIAPIIGARRFGDIHYLDLAMPDHVELGQKRRHMRLDIPKNDVVDFRIWPGVDDQSPPCEADLDQWPEPLAIYRQDMDSQVSVLDLSGGGIRLEYDPRQFPNLNTFLRRYTTLFMRLELIPMAPRLPSVYYMSARLRTKQENFETGSLMLGYEFVECGQAQATGDINWLTIDPDHGVEDLVTWIFKRHLELYREREIG